MKKTVFFKREKKISAPGGPRFFYRTYFYFIIKCMLE
ncbi:hypothetical protein KKC_00777 [Listeria fleischmannii subsp. coloradonensis]|nr:hypothetical protein KKC_00777 [Listeria fleischmannii subsp. coloradonensis]